MAGLIIGDRAIGQEKRFPFVYDLGGVRLRLGRFEYKRKWAGICGFLPVVLKMPLD